MDVEAGTYAGFILGWDAATAGTAGAPITFQADPHAAPGSVIINSRDGKTPVGIDLEPGCDYINISGFTIQKGDGSITKDGIKATGNNDSITNNTVTGVGGFGIFINNANNVLIQGNTVTGTTGTNTTGHGMYISGSSDGTVIRGNVIYDNSYVGIHLNGDVSEGGIGLVTHAVIEDNRIYNNGQSGISADGLQNSIIQNNLIYGYQSFGIRLYQIDAAGGSKNNVIVDNTIVATSSGTGAAVRILDAGTGNTLLNNILLGSDGITYRISSDSLPGLVSDYNASGGVYQSEDTGATQTLAQWRATDRPGLALDHGHADPVVRQSVRRRLPPNGVQPGGWGWDCDRMSPGDGP